MFSVENSLQVVALVLLALCVVVSAKVLNHSEQRYLGKRPRYFGVVRLDRDIARRRATRGKR